MFPVIQKSFLHRLAKALWFKSLEPDIGPSLAEVVEEEDYDEYDEGFHYNMRRWMLMEEATVRVDGGGQREDDTLLEELDDEGVTQVAEEYDYEAGEEGRIGRRAMTLKITMKMLKMYMGKPTSKNTLRSIKEDTVREPVKLHISLNQGNMVVATVYMRMSFEF